MLDIRRKNKRKRFLISERKNHRDIRRKVEKKNFPDTASCYQEQLRRKRSPPKTCAVTRVTFFFFG